MSSKYQPIYDRIPSFQCEDGCNDCCTVMPQFTSEEWEGIKEKRFSHGFECPYKGEGRCLIYDDRSFTCRIFGNAEGMQCPKGYGPEKLLTHKEYQALRLEYFSLF